jgi:hypothetical protein
MKRRKSNTIITDSTGTYLLLYSAKHGTACAYFDPEDIDLVDQHTWGIMHSRTRRQGANLEVRTNMMVNGVRKTILLHRYLFPVADPLVTDHIDGNVLNCRRSNLRAVTPQQNQWNRVNALGYSWCDIRCSYRARIIVNKQYFCLGYHQTAKQARAAYLTAKAQLHVIPDQI